MDRFKRGPIMKLWLLRPIETRPPNDDPWKPWYDKSFGFVVRAKTETEARQLANVSAGDETRGAWINARYSTCEPLTSEGEAGVIIQDFAAA